MSLFLLGNMFQFFLQQGGLPESIKDLPFLPIFSKFKLFTKIEFLCVNKVFFQFSKNKKFLVELEKKKNK